MTAQTQIQFRFAIESKLAQPKTKNGLRINSGVKRGRMEIIAEILLLCERQRAKTNIMYKTNLNYAQLQTHLNSLISLGMLMSEEGFYMTTQKGFHFLELFAELQGILTGQNT